MVDATFRMVSSKCGAFLSGGWLYLFGACDDVLASGMCFFPGGDLEFGCAVKIRRALILSSYAAGTSQHELDFELCS